MSAKKITLKPPTSSDTVSFANLMGKFGAVKNEETAINPMDLSNDSLPENEILPALTGNETLLGNETYGNKTLLGNEMSGNELLLGNETYGNKTLLGNEMFGNDLLPSHKILPSNEILLSNESLQDKTLPSNETLPDKTLPSNETLPDKTLPSNETLPYWSNFSQPGKPVADEQIFSVLDLGISDLMSREAAAAAVLFYWAFSKQRRSILVIHYAQLVEELNFTKPKISRSLDRIRESTNFSVVSTRKGVYIILDELIKKTEKSYPHSDQSIDGDGNESLPLVVSSSSLRSLRSTTTNSGAETYPLLKIFGGTDLRVLADLIVYYGFGKKETTPKLVSLMVERYQKDGLDSISDNLSYVSSSKRVGSAAAYLIKAFGDDYGKLNLSFEQREQGRKICEVLKKLRDTPLGEFGASQLKEILYDLNRPVPISTSRDGCEEAIKKILDKSEDLYQKIKAIRLG